VNLHLARGFGPLVVAAILFILMVLLAPTVAPERIVEEPVHAPTTTTIGINS
jgi:poly-D-alanine transfer protein DltD